MNKAQARNQSAATQQIRCAIYTRKSTDEGLEKEFNSLDAQRESGEAYVASQQHEGWICVPDRYDDGGFSGGNMDRPALKRLMTDIEAGKIDSVIVYKVDRLSRSLLDFAKIVETFDRHHISFVSVTQLINTATSMGRLMLNVLLSFAQFEREIISERTRDKIAAARRKGKWSGGMPLLGYDVLDRKLTVNRLEAGQVRQIFALYLELGALVPVVQELNRRGWTNKAWTTKKDRTRRGGRPFNKSRLYELLTNVTYIGQVRYKQEIHPGEHEAIVEADVFRRVQVALQHNGRGSPSVRNKYGALLRGLLRCKACGCGMAHSYTSKGPRRYRYYVCVQAQQRGWKTCPSPSVPAGEIEQFVVDQIRGIGRDPALVAATVAQVRRQSAEVLQHLDQEQAAIVRQQRADEAELRRLAASPPDAGRAGRMAEILERQRLTEGRLVDIGQQQGQLEAQRVDEHRVAAALADFDEVWAALSSREQARVLELLIERIDYDAQEGRLSITFLPTGIQTLAERAPGEHAA